MTTIVKSYISVSGITKLMSVMSKYLSFLKKNIVCVCAPVGQKKAPGPLELQL